MIKGKIFEDGKVYDFLKKLGGQILPAISMFLFAVQTIFSNYEMPKISFWCGLIAAIIAAAAAAISKYCEESSKVYWANKNNNEFTVLESEDQNG